MRHVVLIPLCPHYLEWTRPLHACSPRGARVAQRARRVLRVSLRRARKSALEVYKYTRPTQCTLVFLLFAFDS